MSLIRYTVLLYIDDSANCYNITNYNFTYSKHKLYMLIGGVSSIFFKYIIYFKILFNDDKIYENYYF